MTVSRVVNGSGYVSEETRNKVLDAVKKLNYRPNGLARGLRRQRTETVGLVLADLANPYSAELAMAVREALRLRGYNLFITISEHSGEEDMAAIESLVDHNVDGLIVATRSTKQGDKRLHEIAGSPMPVVVIGRELKRDGADSVSVDNLTGGFEATQHLIDLGHKQIGFIGADIGAMTSLKRLQGYAKALEQHGISINERFITGRKDTIAGVPGYSTEKIGYESMKRLLSLPNPPTAVFARNDFTAIGAMTAIKEAGLSIPVDIAIVGFDDIPMATHTSPPLTTVRQPVRSQGRLAAEMLLKRISDPKMTGRTERVLTTELIVRGSTASVS